MGESELFELSMQRRRDQHNWSTQVDGLRERKRTLNNILAEQASKTQEVIQHQELQELRAARMQLSEVELRSQEAQQGLSAALTQLSLRQVGNGNSFGQLASAAQAGRGRSMNTDNADFSWPAGLKPAYLMANGRSSTDVTANGRSSTE